ncbi:MAG: hypothetical protein OEZ01_12835 [Candidatus Heimdallarchaeota archaeon]|nr:hypothetical protein [Candidatus Heimdallarchaeota archaeon]MDH5646892.1 hypothetical protein [Candidatus Heimdallarchaeota archaeon]
MVIGNIEGNVPKSHLLKKEIIGENGSIFVYLYIVEFENAIVASIYDKGVKLGSMSMGLPSNEVGIDSMSIFYGRDNQMADGLALILSKKLNKIVYASVNVVQQTSFSISTIRELVDEYIKSKEVNLSDSMVSSKID